MSNFGRGTANHIFEMKGYLGKGGAGLSRLYTKSGYILHFNPYEDESKTTGCVLEIPRGRKFMRKLAARYSALERSNNMVEVSDLRDALRQLDSIKNTYGHCTAKEVRFLASQILSGFTVVSNEKGDTEKWFERNKIALERNGREVKIKDVEGEFSFIDDYYNTGLKALLWEHLRSGEIAIGFTDERERVSVKRILGSFMDEDLVGFFLDGRYEKTTSTRFWGGKFDGWRPLKLPALKAFKDTVKLVRVRQGNSFVPLLMRKDGWFNITKDILTGKINRAETEALKDKLPRNEYRRMRKELGRRHRAGSRTLDNVCLWVTNYLEEEYLLHGKREWAMSFLIRGSADLLHWDGGLQSQYVATLRAMGCLEQKKVEDTAGGCSC